MAARTHRDVSPAQARDAADRIAERRRACDDPDLEQLSDTPLDVVKHVADRQRVPHQVLAADVLDALLVLEYIRQSLPAIPRVLDSLERRVLVAGAKAGLSYQQMAEALGLKTKQAVDHRIRRLASAERGEARSERADRAFRRAQADQAAWAVRHGAELLTATASLVANRDGFAAAGLADEVDQIAEAVAAVFPAGEDRRPGAFGGDQETHGSAARPGRRRRGLGAIRSTDSRGPRNGVLADPSGCASAGPRRRAPGHPRASELAS